MSSNKPDVTSLRQDTASLQSDWASLASAESADLSCIPLGGPPAASDEATTLTQANAALSKYQKAVTADTATIAGYLTQANQYVAKANQLCSSAGG